MDTEDGLLHEFITEAKEHLATIEEILLTLEKDVENPEAELIARVFRAIHSIKGAAGFLGLTGINTLSHQMETTLSLVRSGELKPSPECVDALLVGVDRLVAMLDDVSASDNVRTDDIVTRLSALVDGELRGEVQRAQHTPVQLNPAENVKEAQAAGVVRELAEFNLNEFDLSHRNAQHDHLYLLRYDLHKLADAHVAPLQLLRRLLQTGEILAGRINCEDYDLHKGPPNGPVGYDIIYSTVLAEDLIGVVAELPFEDIVTLAIPVVDQAPIVHGAVDASAAEAEKLIADGENMDNTDIAESTDIAEAAGTAIDGVAVGQPGTGTRSSGENRGSETVRISVEILDRLMNLAGELVLVRNQQLMSLERSDGHSLRAIVQRLDLVTSELQETIMRTRMQPVGNIFNKFPRLVRDLAGKLNKRFELNISGSEVELDKTILESLADPLTHIIRNCCDHAIETVAERTKLGKNPSGKILLRAFHEGGQINIEICDDGRGIPLQKIRDKAVEKGLHTSTEIGRLSEKEVLALLFLPGFSTAEKVTDISGRGVGMDVVKTSVEKLGGSVDIDTVAGKGTTLRLRLPLTLAIIPCLIVASGAHRYAIPQINLEELVRLYDEETWRQIDCVGSREVYRLRDHLLPMVRLNEILAHSEPFDAATQAGIAERYHQRRALARQQLADGEEQNAAEAEDLTFAVVKVGASRMGLIVDQVLGTEEIVVKPMHAALKKLDCYAGATVMGDGRVALILNVDGIAAHAGIAAERAEEQERTSFESAESASDVQSVLLFRSGSKERFAVALPLVRRLERVRRADFEEAGDREFINIDGVPTRILRLDRLLNVSPCEEREEMYLLLPKHARLPVGVLISKIDDIVQCRVELEENGCSEDGIMGSAIIRERFTLFPDLYRLFDRLCAAEVSTVEKEQDEPARILLAEDMAFFRRLVGGYLAEQGHTVVQVENGKQALDALMNSAGGEPFDLLISDLEMPEINGWEFMQKARESGCEIPAVALSSLNDPVSSKRALEAGFDRFELKFERESFVRTVRDLLRTKRVALV